MWMVIKRSTSLNPEPTMTTVYSGITGVNLIYDPLNDTTYSVDNLQPNQLLTTDGSGQITTTAAIPASAITGVLPIANGGTNSSTALTNGKLMVSSAGTIIEGPSTDSPIFDDTLEVGGNLLYQTGTISQSVGTTVVGVGTTFTASMRGGILYPDGYTASLILEVVSATQLTVNRSAIILAGTSYSIRYGANIVSISHGYAAASQQMIVTSTSNQLSLGQTNITTISADVPVASRTYTIPDSGANSSFVLSDGNQTINGTKTFSTPIGISSGGTNSSATPTDGGIAYGDGTSYAFTAAGTTGQVLTSNGTSPPTWEPASGGGSFQVVQTLITATGAGTYTPTSGMEYVIVEVQGPGGAGGNSSAGGGQHNFGNGGGAGGYVKALYTAADIGVSRGYVVGVAGSSNTSFSSGATELLASRGGAGGTQASVGSGSSNFGDDAGGASGTTTIGGSITNAVRVSGARGNNGWTLASTGQMGGAGGDSFLGRGGANITGINDNGNDATGYGGGGGGAASLNNNTTGGVGGPACIIFTEYIAI